MPAVPPYIPPKQAGFDSWFNNFSTLITAAPSTYGLTSADATTIAGYYSTWHAAYLLVVSPTTKTAATVAAKNTALATILPPVRAYAQQISNNPGVTSANKIALGLNPKTSTPGQITAPVSNPVLTLQSQGPGQAILRYRDSAASVSVKSKPYGVKMMLLVGAPTSLAVLPASMFKLVNATKSPFVLNLATLPAATTGVAPAGTPYTFSGFWVTQKQQMSPPAPVLQLTTT